MNSHSFQRMAGFTLMALLLVGTLSHSLADPPKGSGQGQGKGKGPPADMKADQAVFHYLLENHDKIRRSVNNVPNGVETLTESDDKAVTLKIQEHVASMHKRVKEKRGLRFWDELFVVLFRNADKITMKVENTPKGVKVLETSDDAYTVKLIQLHATVVSRFVKYGFDEAHKEHPVPAKEDSVSQLVTPIIPGYGGVLALPDAVEQPRKGAKIIFDITAGDTDIGLNKGVERVARLLNLYGAAGMKASDVTIVMVLHGEATTAVMTEKAYAAKHPGKKNTSLPAIQALQKAGVKVLVCGQALGYKKINRADVAPNIGVAAAALTVIMNKQDDGFSYVPVH